ncbi:MAG: hypothetical protein DRP02_06380 [Candidatus Gerdarchaeota archaeon]|nr:MAG: hypothetical protein DRP02_06380 [Candidatus Gerdarchaeota archaeon]
MKDWFEAETEGSVRKIRSELRKRFENISSNMEDLKIAAQDFEVKDTIDAESRSSQNIYEKMTEMVEEFEIPQTITYSSAQAFLKDLEKFLSRVLTLGSRFIRNLKKNKYRTRVFILQRALTRLQKNYQELENFLENKTVLLQEVDETSEGIENLIKKVHEREKIKKAIVEEKELVSQHEEKLQALKEEYTKITTGTAIEELEEITREEQIIVNKIKLVLGGLDKPLRKLISRAQDGKVMVPPGLIDLANQLKEDTKTALEKMDKGHPQLSELMEILQDAVEKNKLKLKPSMQNKTKTLTKEIIEGSIKEQHNELLRLVSKRNEIEQKIDQLGLRGQLEEITIKREAVEKDKLIVERRLKELQNQLESINNEIASLAAQIQRKVRKLTSQDVKINIKDYVTNWKNQPKFNAKKLNYDLLIFEYL